MAAAAVRGVVYPVDRAEASMVELQVIHLGKEIPAERMVELRDFLAAAAAVLAQ